MGGCKENSKTLRWPTPPPVFSQRQKKGERLQFMAGKRRKCWLNKGCPTVQINQVQK